MCFFFLFLFFFSIIKLIVCLRRFVFFLFVFSSFVLVSCKFVLYVMFSEQLSQLAGPLSRRPLFQKTCR